MFLPHNQTLLADLATGGTRVLLKADGSKQDFDEYRLSPAAHVLMVDDVRYTSPTDFTLSSDGSGDITLTWLNATTLVTGKILRIGVAYIDLIVAGAQGGGGTGSSDATAANQALQIAKLQLIIDAINSTVPSPVYGAANFVDVTLSTDTVAYAAGDLLADTQAIAAAVWSNDALGMLQSISLIDESDSAGVAIDLYFLSANNSMGAENSAPTLSDANAAALLGKVSIAAADWTDIGGVKHVSKTGIGMVVKPAAGTTTVYVAAVLTAGTPTFTATSLKARFGLLS